MFRGSDGTVGGGSGGGSREAVYRYATCRRNASREQIQFHEMSVYRKVNECTLQCDTRMDSCSCRGNGTIKTPIHGYYMTLSMCR